MIQLRGYWWQCEKDLSHVATPFKSVAGIGIVEFLFQLAENGWDQARLMVPCTVCRVGTMRITYDFPREDRVCLSVHHIVGVVTNLPHYLPMLWEAVAHGETEPWFDFKYVGRSKEGHHQAYGLARPAVFSRSDLAALFAIYHRIVGQEILPQDAVTAP